MENENFILFFRDIDRKHSIIGWWIQLKKVNRMWNRQLRSNCFKPFEENQILLKSCLFSSNLQFYQPKHLTNKELFFHEKFADQEVNTATNKLFFNKKIQKIPKNFKISKKFQKNSKEFQKIAKSSFKNPSIVKSQLSSNQNKNQLLKPAIVLQLSSLKIHFWIQKFKILNSENRILLLVGLTKF